MLWILRIVCFEPPPVLWPLKRACWSLLLLLRISVLLKPNWMVAIVWQTLCIGTTRMCMLYNLHSWKLYPCEIEQQVACHGQVTHGSRLELRLSDFKSSFPLWSFLLSALDFIKQEKYACVDHASASQSQFRSGMVALRSLQSIIFVAYLPVHYRWLHPRYISVCFFANHCCTSNLLSYLLNHACEHVQTRG